MSKKIKEISRYTKEGVAETPMSGFGWVQADDYDNLETRLQDSQTIIGQQKHDYGVLFDKASGLEKQLQDSITKMEELRKSFLCKEIMISQFVQAVKKKNLIKGKKRTNIFDEMCNERGLKTLLEPSEVSK